MTRRCEKSRRAHRDGIVRGNTLKSRQAYGRIGDSSESLDRRRGEQHLILLRKGERGMSAKPMH
jgi:hypothetical protein